MKNVFLSFAILGIPLNNTTIIEIQDNHKKQVSSIEQESIFHILNDPLFVKNDVIKNKIEDVKQKANQPATNAYFTRTGEMKQGSDGKIIDEQDLEQKLWDYLFQDISKPISIKYKTIKPTVTKNDLQNIKDKKLGSFQTYYNKDYKERATNIRLATDAIDYHVIAPGESFSFNNVVGERTEEKGYQKAPVIVKGELSEDIGGGICQLSSTLYNAVELPGIKIEKRYSHSRDVPYVPKGKDAAVSWNGPDFVFLNQYDSPLLLRAKAKNGILTVQVFGQESIKKN